MAIPVPTVDDFKETTVMQECRAIVDYIINTLVPAINEGGGGSSYVLPPATTSTLGGVIVGDNLNVDGTGKVSLPIGGTNIGGVKNGGNVTIKSDGTMSSPSIDFTESPYISETIEVSQIWEMINQYNVGDLISIHFRNIPSNASITDSSYNRIFKFYYGVVFIGKITTKTSNKLIVSGIGTSISSVASLEDHIMPLSAIIFFSDGIPGAIPSIFLNETKDLAEDLFQSLTTSVYAEITKLN